MLTSPVTLRREASDILSSHVSSTVASHRSFASQVPSSTKTSCHGAGYEAAGPGSSDSFIPPHVNKPIETIDNEWAKTPFVMPDDEEIFRIRSLEKKRKEQKKLDNMLPVSEKTTFASRMAATIASDSLKEELLAINTHIAKEMESIKAAKILPTEHYHKEKENMAEFIAKKREIFLVQMSLDNKRAEIRKLEERSFQREEALRKSKEMLVEDTAQFEAFLKQNDEKFQEQLDECKKYKDFIMNLTPKDWLDANSHVSGEHIKKKNDSKESGDLISEGDNPINDVVGEEMDMSPVEQMYFRSPNQAPIPRKTGKPIMFRSRLFKKKKLQVAEVKTDDDRELVEFLERDF